MLAVHVARLPDFATTILTSPELNLAATKLPPLIFEGREELLSTLKKTSGEARAAGRLSRA
jgi:hypothetical protein